MLKDIVQYLELDKPNVFRGTYARPNISFVVRHTTNKLEQLLSIVRGVGGSGIVYCRTRKSCEDVADFLRSQNVSADFYHAGMLSPLRNAKQREWTAGNIRIIVATNAFGMGIDKADVRSVVHYEMPQSIESYYQEAGRAGRDGNKSWAVMLYEERDRLKSTQRLAIEYPPMEDIKKVYEKLHNFLSIGIGEGKEQLFDFSLMDFATYAKMYSPTIHSALKILELNGYIALTEELDNPTRIRFRIARDELYRFRVENHDVDNFLKVLLRSYTGLFSDFIAIDEAHLSRISGFTEAAVVKMLLELSRSKVINYIPRRRTPLVALLIERLPVGDVYIAPSTYASRRMQSEIRSLSMVEYTLQEGRCRARILREYFDEAVSENCGVCDVCLSSDTPKEQKEARVQSVEEQIVEMLRGGDKVTMAEVVGQVRASSQVTLRALRALMSRRVIKQVADGSLRLCE